MSAELYDAIVIGGGPAGATAAHDLAQHGRLALLVDREGRPKPCGGAIPPRAIQDFDIPQQLLTARITAARMVSPSDKTVDMVIGNNGYVGMVDRDVFDPWLRARAEQAGAERIAGTFQTIVENGDGTVTVTIRDKTGDQPVREFRGRSVIGADGANSSVRRAVFGAKKKPPFVFAYHEIIRSPRDTGAGFDPSRCDVVYNGDISPDFYGWIFPHGDATSVGCGSAIKGFDLKAATKRLRTQAGLDGCETLRFEGAPLPLKPLKRWDNGRNVVLAGDAAGVVAPSSGEGIYYAMLSGRLAADAVDDMIAHADARRLKTTRKRFMKDHGRVFFMLRLMQSIWYRNDKRREQFVKMCRDPDVQRLTWESYLNKRLVRRDPMAHLRVFSKDLQQLLGLSTR